MNTKVQAADGALTDDSQGMSYLNRLPRRIVTIYIPMALFVFVLG